MMSSARSSSRANTQAYHGRIFRLKSEATYRSNQQPSGFRLEPEDQSYRRRSRPGASIARWSSPASSQTTWHAGQVSMTMLPGP
jgi:hypothetical protein